MGGEVGFMTLAHCFGSHNEIKLGREEGVVGGGGGWGREGFNNCT